jgi:two-component system KDP operon response regulator KdpE
MRAVVAGTGVDGLRIAAAEPPDLIVMDLGLPDFDGLKLCRMFRAAHRCPIIVVTADGDERMMVAALEGGADDYVVKPWSQAVLLARASVALRHAVERAAMDAETTFQVGDLFLDVEGHLVLAGDRPVDVSPRQFRLLTALMRNAGRVLTHKELAMVGSGTGGDVVKADGLKGAMSQLRKQLGTGPRRPAIVPEPHVGYRLVPADGED